MTNYERIKGMSKCELAHFLSDITCGESIDTRICNQCYVDNGYVCKAENDMSKCLHPNTNLEWLDKEYEDGR